MWKHCPPWGDAGSGVRMSDVTEILSRIESGDPAATELVKLRYFAGLTLPQAAEALGVSRSTDKKLPNFDGFC